MQRRALLCFTCVVLRAGRKELLRSVRMRLLCGLEHHEVETDHALHKGHVQRFRIFGGSLQPLHCRIRAGPTHQRINTCFGRRDEWPRAAHETNRRLQQVTPSGSSRRRSVSSIDIAMAYPGKCENLESAWTL